MTHRIILNTHIQCTASRIPHYLLLVVDEVVVKFVLRDYPRKSEMVTKNSFKRDVVIFVFREYLGRPKKCLRGRFRTHCSIGSF